MGIERKKKECVKCGKQTFIFSKGRCKMCANVDYMKKVKPNRRKTQDKKHRKKKR